MTPSITAILAYWLFSVKPNVAVLISVNGDAFEIFEIFHLITFWLDFVQLHSNFNSFVNELFSVLFSIGMLTQLMPILLTIISEPPKLDK